MKSIGGYFELEGRCVGTYHNNAIALNTARNAFEYVLQVRQYSKVYIPYFTCEVLLEPLKKLDIGFEFYHIDKNLEPIFDFSLLKNDQGFLYTNYFGIKDNYITYLVTEVPNLIIDNAQSFFSPPAANIDTIYSCRKFFGLSDGALLYCNKELDITLEQDESYQRMSHLLIRAELTAERGYAEFCQNDSSLSNQPILKMSNLTDKLLLGIDYEHAKNRRIENFNFLHQHLKGRNKLTIEKEDAQVPLVYPFWTTDTELKSKLIQNKIYCATYWPNVLQWCDENSLEVQLTRELIHLPIDQRYNIMDMKYILEHV